MTATATVVRQADLPPTTHVYGPSVRWVKSWRVDIFQRLDGWAATYRYRNGSAMVSGCESRQEAASELRHFLTMRVAEVDGQFVEVTR